jgi:hypothetical protein
MTTTSSAPLWTSKSAACIKTCFDMKLIRFAVWLALVLCLLAGCATKPLTNWQARIGNYTYDQAVQRLGQPDKRTKLDDGAIVAEWLRGSEPAATIGYKGGVDAGQMDWMQPEAVTIYPAGADVQRWLRLVFGPDGELRSWENFQR